MKKIFIFFVFYSLLLNADPFYLISSPNSVLNKGVLRSSNSTVCSLFNKDNKLAYLYALGNGSFTKPNILTSSNTDVYNSRFDELGKCFNFYSFDNNIYYSYGLAENSFKEIKTYTVNNVNVIYSSLMEYNLSKQLFILLLDTDQGLLYLEYDRSSSSFKNGTLIENSLEIFNRFLAVATNGDVLVGWQKTSETCASPSSLFWAFKNQGNLTFNTTNTIQASPGSWIKINNVNFVGKSNTTYFMITYIETSGKVLVLKGFLINDNGVAQSTYSITPTGDVYILDKDTGLVFDSDNCYKFSPVALESNNIVATFFSTVGPLGADTNSVLTIDGSAFVSFSVKNSNGYSYLKDNSSTFSVKGLYGAGAVPSFITPNNSPGSATLTWSVADDRFSGTFIFSNRQGHPDFLSIRPWTNVFYQMSLYP